MVTMGVSVKKEGMNIIERMLPSAIIPITILTTRYIGKSITASVVVIDGVAE